jgi:hypothetical protein
MEAVIETRLSGSGFWLQSAEREALEREGRRQNAEGGMGGKRELGMQELNGGVLATDGSYGRSPSGMNTDCAGGQRCAQQGPGDGLSFGGASSTSPIPAYPCLIRGQ